MRMRTKKWAKPELYSCGIYIDNPKEYIGTWQEQFKRKAPLHIELGCGKGIFTAIIACGNPDVNYIAIDMSTDILGVCSRNVKKEFDGKPCENLKLVSMNIEKITESFSKADEIERIYINFCNPWQKSKHNKRRLTHTTKLEMYKAFLKRGSSIYFKTDDDDLFCDSIGYFKSSGFEIKRLSYDLHNEHFKDREPNIPTEHEKMFSEQGVKIKFLEAVLK